MKTLIRKENKLAIQAHKMKTPTTAPKDECVQWLHIHIVRLGKQLTTKFKNKLTAADRVLAIIRILSIMHHMPHARELYLQMDLLPSAHQLQKSGTAGEGVGKFAACWSFISDMFNDEAVFSSPFPYDHIPKICTLLQFKGGPTKLFHPPDRYVAGLLAGLGLLSGSKPVGFIEGFFDFRKLSDIWSDCLEVYRIHESRFVASGMHGSVPRYHFVLPGTQVVWGDDDCQKMFSAVKRWDSIAVHEFLEMHQDFLSHFKCKIQGGVGGITEETSSPLSVNPPPSTSKSRSQLKKTEDMVLAQHNFTANLVKVLAFQHELPPKTALTNELLQVTSTLRELIAAADASDVDIITHYQNRKTELKTLILNLPPPP